MKYNISEFNNKYDFNLIGASFIGNPRDNTILFVTKKIKRLADNLKNVKHCLAFVDSTIPIDDLVKVNNCIVSCDNPQEEYASFVLKIASAEKKKNRKYILSDGGYYIGENVTLGKNCCIEPNCVIGHDVVIGDNCLIGAGCSIKNAIIGKSFVCGENTTIGTDAFFLSELDGKEIKIPSFGNVIIYDNVDVGANVVVERGFNADTIINECVKIDSLVCIGHDDDIGEYVQITGGATIAGLVTIGAHSYVAMNSTIKQRLILGENVTVGMGSVVISNVKDGCKVFGNPARKMEI